MNTPSNALLDIASLARQAGATNEAGGRAEGVYCFTEQELVGFSQQLARECLRILKEEEHRRRNDFMGDDPPLLSLTSVVYKSLGIDR